MAPVCVAISKAVKGVFLKDSLDDLGGSLEGDLDIAAVLAPLDCWHADFLEGGPYLRSSQSVSSSQNEDGELLWEEKE